MAQNVVYGPGGFDPSQPDNNIVSVEEVPDPPAQPKTAAEIAAEHATIETIADMEAFRAALEQLGGVDTPPANNAQRDRMLADLAAATLALGQQINLLRGDVDPTDLEDPGV